MNATRILWGQVPAVSAIVIAFLWEATEWVAWRRPFEPPGPAWFSILGWPVNDPPACFQWWLAYVCLPKHIIRVRYGRGESQTLTYW